MTRNKSLFTASFDGAEPDADGRGYDNLTRFTHWLAKCSASRSASPWRQYAYLIHGIDYESWLYEISQPESGRECV